MSEERIKVLVVDDDPATLAMVEQTFASNPGLAALGVAVEGAPRKQGLAAFRLHSPDLLITDMAPSQIEDYHLIDVVRADPAGQDLPILVVSASYDDARSVQRLQSDYCVGFEPKPLSLEGLVRAIQGVLPRQRHRPMTASVEVPSLEVLCAQAARAEIATPEAMRRATPRYLEAISDSGVKDVPPTPIPAGDPPPASAGGAAAAAPVAGVAGVARPLPPGTLAVGEVIGNYVIEAQLSEQLDRKSGRRAGAMGVVYRARHRELDKVVAIKALSRQVSQTPELYERFRREPQAASSIGHPNIVEIHHTGADAGSIYFVMEYLQGHDLSLELERHGALAIDRVLVIGTQICQAMAAAHDAGLIHRDLKPRHIFLVQRGNLADLVKVLDFGVVKVQNLEPGEDALTRPGVALGTPTYMAPEQGEARSYDHRVDIYALGVILYEMLTGKPPHPCSKLTEAIVRKATEPVVSPREARPEIPPALERMVLRALSYKPEERPATMAEIGQALRAQIAPDAVPPVLLVLETLRR